MNAFTPSSALAASATPVDGFGWLQHKAGTRHENMAGLLDFLKDRSSRALTEVVQNKEIELACVEQPETRDDLNKLAFLVNGQPREMTHYSFGQLAGLAKAPAKYLRSLPAALVKDAIEFGLRFNREVEEVKPYFDANELRSINGPSYGRVDDWEVVEAVQSILDGGRWVPAEKHMGLSVTDRSLQMFLIDQSNPIVVGKTLRGDDDVMYRGLRIMNSELGYSSLAVQGFTFRSYCLNGCIFGKGEIEQITIRHSKNAPARWAREVQPAIEAYTTQDNSLFVEQVQKVKETIVAKDDEAAVAFMNNRGLSRTQARSAIERIEQEEGSRARTAWDLAQGITSLARDISITENRADLEKVAGDIWTKAAA